MKIYNQDDHLVAIDENNNYLVKFNNNFYKFSENEYKETFGEQVMKIKTELKDSSILSFTMFLTIALTLAFYFSKEKFVMVDKNFFIANMLLLINIFLHEVGHIIFLKVFSPQSNIKMGFKIYFIYPAFYVDTSHSYFLPKHKRVAVYLAGNFMNCLYLIFCNLFFQELNKYNYLIISTILINFIPIIKSDGYYAFKTLINQYNFDKTKLKNYLEDTIRGVLMFIFLYVLSKIGIFF